MKLSKLKVSEDLLAFRKIDIIVVSRYRQAYRTGAKFPPIVVDGTNTIISGNHRYQAMVEEYGQDHEADVVVKKFQNRGDMLTFFAKENSTHGNPLDGFSRRKIAIEMIGEGITADQVAGIFGVPVQRIAEWGGQCVYVIGKGSKPSKYGLQTGIRVSQKQYAEHCSNDKGGDAIMMIRQLTRWAENGWIDFARDDIVDAWKKLSEVVANRRT